MASREQLDDWVERLTQERLAGRLRYDSVLPVLSGSGGMQQKWSARLDCRHTYEALESLGCRLPAEPMVYLEACARAALQL